MDSRKVMGVILRACCSPAPILSGPFRFLRNILASWKIYRAVSKYPSKISPKMTAKNLSELSNHRSTCAAVRRGSPSKSSTWEWCMQAVLEYRF